MTESEQPNVREAIRQLCSNVEADIGLPNDFITNLRQEDDWSFLVKTAALVEAVVTELIIASVPDPRVHEVLTRLRMQGRDGKIALAQSLKLLSPEQLRYVGKVCELRNGVLHDVRHVAFTFQSHLTAMAESQRREFWKALLDADATPTAVAFWPEHARFTFWFALLLFLSHSMTRKADLRLEAFDRERTNELGDLAREILQSESSDKFDPAPYSTPDQKRLD